MMKTNKKNNDHTNSYHFFYTKVLLKKKSLCATLINYSANTDTVKYIYFLISLAEEAVKEYGIFLTFL